LSEAEQKALSEGKDLNQLQIAWSAKEALYKIIGKEAVDFSNHLQLFSFEAQKEGKINVVHIPTNKIYNLRYIQTSDYTLVYCLDN
jgi:4'-phosphopantetheinyl transferase EntD